MNTPPPASPRPRIISIDALRGFIMAAMIFVNDLAGAGRVVPDWMVHYSDRHASGSGMTFVDLVFPGFLFLVGMSIPFALGSALQRPGGLLVVSRHVLVRTASLLLIGVLMVNESPDAARLGWSPALWSALLYVGAIAAFSDLAIDAQTEDARQHWRWIGGGVRVAGFALLAFLALSFVGPEGQRIITFAPLSVRTEWWGILGLIGWAYLVGAIVFLLFRENRTALLGSMVLLFCLYPAERAGLFEPLWLSRYVGIGGSLGSQAAITVGGILLATILSSGPAGLGERQRWGFTLSFIAGTAGAAILVHGLYGIWKNNATPSWCLWACAVTAALWLLFYTLCDVRPLPQISGPLALAGRNVLLAYLLSDLLPSALVLLHLDAVYGSLASTLTGAVLRSIGCAVAILAASVALNRAGLRLKL